MKGKVLVVDDQKNWRDTLKTILEEKELQVTVAHGYEVAVNLLLDEPDLEVVVTDIRLDDNDKANEQGIHLLREIASRDKYTASIVITGYPKVRTTKEALQGFEAFDYVEKRPEEGGNFDIPGFQQSVLSAVRMTRQRRFLDYVVPFSERNFSQGSGKCFVLMPFADEHLKFYRDVTKETIDKKLHMSCERADDFFRPASIMRDIWKSINEAEIIIADLTGGNANVYYELGLSHALNKTVMLIAQSRADVPQRLQAFQILEYQTDWSGAKDYRKQLRTAIRCARRSGANASHFGWDPAQEVDPQLCLVLVGSSGGSASLYERMVKQIIEDEFDLECTRIEDMFTHNRILDDTWSMLNRAHLIVADLSEKPLEVFYGIGVSHALGKKTILISSTLEDVPFDLRGFRCLLYDRQLYNDDINLEAGKDFEDKLIATIKSCLTQSGR